MEDQQNKQTEESSPPVDLAFRAKLAEYNIKDIKDTDTLAKSYVEARNRLSSMTLNPNTPDEKLLDRTKDFYRHMSKESRLSGGLGEVSSKVANEWGLPAAISDVIVGEVSNLSKSRIKDEMYAENHKNVADIIKNPEQRAALQRALGGKTPQQKMEFNQRWDSGQVGYEETLALVKQGTLASKANPMNSSSTAKAALPYNSNTLTGSVAHFTPQQAADELERIMQDGEHPYFKGDPEQRIRAQERVQMLKEAKAKGNVQGQQYSMQMMLQGRTF